MIFYILWWSNYENKMRLNYNFLDHILNLFFYILIFTFVKSSYSARRNPNRNNQIIYAKLGDTINITCWFDPKLFNTNSHVNNFNSIQEKRKRRRSPLLNHNHSRRKATSKLPLSIETINTNNNNNNNNKNHKHHYEKSRHSKKSLDYYNENRQDNYFKQSISYNKNNDENDLQDINDINTDIIKYELDWYFLDRQGRMNIISYGNRTSKDTKYKTFILANTNEGSIKTRVIDNANTNELVYSSSALYSQSSKSSSSNNYEFTNKNNNINDGNRYYTYYLNALIESEDDEGVYQCINPDLPNFILRNVTVLIERNKATTALSMNLSQSIFFLLLIIYNLY